ncbi:MAG: hypothetical protein Q8P50_16625 [Bacillota bacterium]|nr:hypothetical protein [Bacillota bacterium]
MLLSIPDKTWASSVGPEAIVVGTRLSDERLVASALHEVGVRMLHPHRVLDRPPAGLRAGLPAALPAALTPAQYEHLLRCMEAAVCAEKQALAATLGIAELVASDPFVKSMRLEGLLDEWRTARGDTVLDRLVDMFTTTHLTTRNETDAAAGRARSAPPNCTLIIVTVSTRKSSACKRNCRPAQ